MTDAPFNAVDAVVLLLLLVAVWTGYRAGFVATTYSLASWIVAAAAAIAFEGSVASVIGSLVPLPHPLATTIAFVGVIFAVEALFALAGNVAVRRLVASIRRGPLDGLDRILGIVPSTLRTAFVVAVAILALESLPISSDLKAAVETSRAGRLVADQAAARQAQISAFAAQFGGSPLLVTKLGEEDSEKLALPDDLTLENDPVAERQLYELVTQERISRGLMPLAWDDRLVPVARAHSAEMFKLKYFGHESPVAGSPFDRLKAARITYTRAGENLAYAQSVAVAHRALMDSPGHRENILRPEFTRIGIGVVSAGAYGRMVTELFITP